MNNAMLKRVEAPKIKRQIQIVESEISESGSDSDIEIQVVSKKVPDTIEKEPASDKPELISSESQPNQLTFKTRAKQPKIPYKCPNCEREFKQPKRYFNHLGRIKPCSTAKNLKSLQNVINSKYQQKLDEVEDLILQVEKMIKDKKSEREIRLAKNRLFDNYKAFAGYVRSIAIEEGDPNKYESELKPFIEKMKFLQKQT